MKKHCLVLFVVAVFTIFFPGFGHAHEIEPSKLLISSVQEGRLGESLSSERTSAGKSRFRAKEVVPSSFGELVTLTGILEVYHFDNFDEPDKSYSRYELKEDGGGRVMLETAGVISSPSGTRVRVTGYRTVNSLVTVRSEGRVLVPLTPVPVPESVGEQKTLVILVNFNDSGPEVFDSVSAAQLVFDGKMADFYHEQSAGKVGFAGEVRGWYTLPRSGLVNGACVWPTLGNGGAGPGELDSLLLADGVDFSDYDRVIILAQHPCLQGGWSSIGKIVFGLGENLYRFSLSAVGYLDSYNEAYGNMPFSWTRFDYVLSHELGHALGLAHAKGWHCGAETLYGSCEQVEYGNFFDTMGTGTLAMHFNALEKEHLTWLTGNEILTINQSGRYTLKTFEGDVGPRAARIVFPESFGPAPPFFLEYRRGIGFDIKLDEPALVSNQHGLFANRSIEPVPGLPFSRLLDLTPTEHGLWEIDAQTPTLNLGAGPFVDEGLGLTLGPVVSSGEAGIIFDVSLTSPVCVTSAPAVQVNLASGVAVTGLGFVVMDIMNQDSIGCAESSFNVEVVLPDDWTRIVDQTGNFNLTPQVVATKVVTYQIPAGAGLGPREVTVRVTQGETGLINEQSFTVWVLPTPELHTLEPESAVVGAQVIIIGENLSPNSNTISLTKGGFQVNFPAPADPAGTTILFHVPVLVYSNTCNCQVPTPPGIYQVKVYTYGAVTSSLNFEVLP